MHRDLPLLSPLAPAWREWLDALVEREVLRLRARHELSLDELRGLYISDAQVDALLQERLEDARGGPDALAAFDARAQALAPQLTRAGATAALVERLGLADDEIDLLLCALAPDLDVRYETLYAYLNNDLGRRFLTADLAQRLLASARRSGDAPDVRLMLAPGGTLVGGGILEIVEPAELRSRWQQSVRVALPVMQFCQGLPLADQRWGDDVSWVAPTPTRDAVCRPQPLVLITADEPEERWAAALQWAGGHAMTLLRAPLSMLDGDSGRDISRSLLVAARLAGAALVLDDDRPAAPSASPAPRFPLRRWVGQGVPLVWLAAPATPLAEQLAPWPYLHLPVHAPDAAGRLRTWQLALHERGLPAAPAGLRELADRHALSGAHIRAAVAAAEWAHADGEGLAAALQREAGARANHGLARLASCVQREHRWEQLVLAEPTTRQLHEIADAIRVREQVYRQWGLQRRTGRSAGLMMLFCGASGTGKTMAASVVSHAASLTLYRIDLAGVVSKYIGETEQNLDRIFRAAERASAVLLFDEADALLGRRSEVKDAHDRYANLEVAYLLQKMEEHDGVVILSSNLPKNLDSAFARRMHYTVEFARPGAPLRERLWRGMLPEELPRAADIDFGYLAERFDLTGGEIQTITLDAAFLAAAQQRSLSMEHLMHALSRRQAQQGNTGSMERYREAIRHRQPDHADLG